MKQTFFNLTETRQQEIKDIFMEEFNRHGYESASINRIIERIGIAKGSLYNYTSSKEDFYLFIFKEILMNFAEVQSNPATYRTFDLFDRIEELLEHGFRLWEKYPLKFQFLLYSEIDRTSPMYVKTQAIRKEVAETTLPVLFGNINWDIYSLPKNEIIIIFQWLNNGIREDLRHQISNGISVEKYEEIVIGRLTLFRECLRKGIYKEL